jgi:hypothetical protein
MDFILYSEEQNLNMNIFFILSFEMNKLILVVTEFLITIDDT